MEESGRNSVLCALLAGLTGCAKKEPLSLTVWTYYNGEQLGAFNEAVEAFNATVGRDKEHRGFRFKPRLGQRFGAERDGTRCRARSARRKCRISFPPMRIRPTRWTAWGRVADLGHI